jgi:hypothetical protein
MRVERTLFKIASAALIALCGLILLAASVDALYDFVVMKSVA